MIKFRKFRKNTHAGLSGYVMILFGMIVILYLFGFTNMWDSYSTNAGVVGVEGEEGEPVEGGNIFNPLNIGFSFLTLITSSIYATLVTGVGIIGVFVLLLLFKNNPAIWSYIIPIVLLVVLNIFVFPLSMLGGDMAPMDAIFSNTANFSFTLILLIFFNLFYLLSVVEFIRGTPT